MTPALARFVEALRAGGIAVSPAELLDAAHALDVVGLNDRARVRAALRATLAKQRRSHEPFDRIFDAFFAPPRPAPGERGKRRTGAGSGGRWLSEQAAREPRPSPQGEPKGATRPREAPVVPSKRKPQGATPQDSVRRRNGPRIVRSERAHATLERGAACSPARRDLSTPALTQDERAIARAVPRLLDELRLRSGRRLRRGRHGRLWGSRVLRANLAFGGVPFVLPVRSRKPRRPRVVLMVDVSFSVARAAGFFLWMTAEFLRVGRDARVIAFVDRPVDATDAVRRWLRPNRSGGAATLAQGSGSHPRRLPGAGIAPAGRPFDDLLRSLRGLNLDAPSDYGRALHALLQSTLRPGGRDTVLVVLGDGRTNRFDPLAWTLHEIGRRCRAVLWLVPEPRVRWGTADSALPGYLPAVDVAVECHDLEGLARGLRELLRML